MIKLRTWLASTNGRVFGAFVVAIALHIAGTIMIPGYSSPFSIRAMLVRQV